MADDTLKKQRDQRWIKSTELKKVGFYLEPEIIEKLDRLVVESKSKSRAAFITSLIKMTEVKK